MNPIVRLILSVLFYLLVAAVPIAIIAAISWKLFKRSAVGRELVARVTTGPRFEDIADLASEVDGMRMELIELRERLEATERVVIAGGLPSDGARSGHYSRG